MKNNGLQRRRLVMLLVGIGLWVAGVEARLAHLQVRRHAELVERAARQQQRTIRLNPRRGVIYDARGRELAVSVEVDSLYAVPSAIRDPAAVAKALAPVAGVGLNEAQLARRLAASNEFVWLKRKVDPDTRARVEALRLPGIHWLKESKRFYPKAERAAAVLGYAGLDNEGLAGLEHSWDRVINGKPGSMTVLNDARRDLIIPEGAYRRAPTGGHSLGLTLDESLQFVAERELAAGVRTARARAGSMVILDPATGAVLAMASVPSFDPNAYARYSADAWRNRVVADAYEPGSTFKCISGVAALEEELVRPDDLIDCEMGAFDLGAAVVHDHDPYGVLTFAEVIAHSSNIGAIKVGLRLGPERLERYLRGFGFGAPTGIELPGENPGLLRTRQRWSGLSNAMLSMGQEVNVTPLQLAAAVAAIANGGEYRRPWIVAEVRDTEGALVERFAPPQPRRVVSERSAAAMRSMMLGVVRSGTAREVVIPGYDIAGKTGTAQKAGRGGYRAGAYVASFVGYLPAESPRLLGLVVIDEPRGMHYGSQVAAPIFERVMAQAVRYLGIPPQSPGPAPRFAPPVEALTASYAPGEAPIAIAAGFGTPAPAAARPAAIDAAAVAAGQIPDLRGHAPREAVRWLTRMGADVRLRGRGTVRGTIPAAGTRIPRGGTVTLELGTGTDAGSGAGSGG